MNRSPSDALTPSTMVSCFLSRSTDSPLATVSRGEWSVRVVHSWPSSTAVSTISSIGEPPSLQSECMCRSPRSSAYSSSPPRVSGSDSFSCNDARYAGSSPIAACAITAAVESPTPGRSLSDPALARVRSSSSESVEMVLTALRNASTR